MVEGFAVDFLVFRVFAMRATVASGHPGVEDCREGGRAEETSVMVTEKSGKLPVIFRECRLTKVGGGALRMGTTGEEGVWGDTRLCRGLERGGDLENDWIHGAPAGSEL